MNSESSLDKLTFATVDPHEPEAQALVEALWNELGTIYGNTGPCEYQPKDMQTVGAAFVLAWLDGKPVGCGGIRPLMPGIAEVKRMYVVPGVRRMGIARKVLEHLETLAYDMGYMRLHLETGKPQEAAIRLYEQAGYHRIDCFGEYADDPISICFGKQIA